ESAPVPATLAPMAQPTGALRGSPHSSPVPAGNEEAHGRRCIRRPAQGAPATATLSLTLILEDLNNVGCFPQTAHRNGFGEGGWQWHLAGSVVCSGASS